MLSQPIVRPSCERIILRFCPEVYWKIFISLCFFSNVLSDRVLSQGFMPSKLHLFRREARPKDASNSSSSAPVTSERQKNKRSAVRRPIWRTKSGNVAMSCCSYLHWQCNTVHVSISLYFIYTCWPCSFYASISGTGSSSASASKVIRNSSLKLCSKSQPGQVDCRSWQVLKLFGETKEKKDEKRLASFNAITVVPVVQTESCSS